MPALTHSGGGTGPKKPKKKKKPPKPVAVVEKPKGAPGAPPKAKVKAKPKPKPKPKPAAKAKPKKPKQKGGAHTPQSESGKHTPENPVAAVAKAVSAGAREVARGASSRSSKPARDQSGTRAVHQKIRRQTPHRVGPAPNFDAIVRTAQSLAKNPIRHLAPTREAVKQIAKEHRQKQRREQRAEVKRRSEEQGRQAKNLRMVLGGYPSLARHVPFKSIAAMIADPEAGFDVRKRKDALIVQHWLNSRGRKVKIDGIYGVETHNQLIQAFRWNARQERKRQMAAVTKRFYDTGILKAGKDAPGWWPLGGKAPKPGELLKLLQQGGFTAAMVWNQLLQHSRDYELEFSHWRRKEAEKIATSLYGIWGKGSLVPRGSRELQMMIALHPAMGTRQARAQLESLYTSDTFAEFKNKLMAFQEKEEAAFLKRQKEALEEDKPWWQDTLDFITRPGEWFRTEAVAKAMEIGDIFSSDITFQSGGALGVRAAGYSRAEYRVAAQEWIESLPGGARLAFELIADPLNIVPGIGTIGRVGSAGALGLERAGFLLATAAIPGRSVHVFDDALRVIGHQLGGPVRLGRGVGAAPSALASALRAGDNPIVRYSQADHIFGVVDRATRLKTEAIANARAGVEWMMANGFRPIPKPKAKPRKPESPDKVLKAFDPPDFDQKLSAATKTLLDDTHEGMRLSLPSMLQNTVRELVREGSSLYMQRNRGGVGLSQVGARLLARGAEEARVQITQGVAIDAARAAFKNIVEEVDIDNLPVAERAAVYERANEVARETYQDTVKRAGVYLKGSGDPELVRQIEYLVLDAIDNLEYAVFPALQDLLEEFAIRAGRDLFDEADLWAGRLGNLDIVMRKLGLHAFDPDNLSTIPNPMYNVPVPYHVAKELIESELRRRKARVVANWARREAGGETVNDALRRSELARIEDEITKAWKPVGKGMYVDTRPELEVAGIYARGHAEYLATPRPPAGLGSAFARDVASAPSHGVVDHEIGRMMWNLGGRHEVPENIRGLDPTFRNFYPVRDERELVDQFKNAVGERKIALAQAWDETIPYALRKEGAMWAALQHAQSLPLKTIATGLQASLELWIFATLPLRPGWVVRNVVDNTAKAFIQGARDPRWYFLGAQKPGSGIQSVFELGLRPLREAIRLLDNLVGSDVGAKWDNVLETFWAHGGKVTGPIFRAHGIEVPEAVLERARFVPYRRERVPRPFRDPDPGDGLIARFKDGIWDLMASKPENYTKRVLYRNTFYKALREGKTELQAFDIAWRKVEKTLFDYSQISVLEDNLRLFFPFIQFWRKNTAFWVTTALDKPWVPLAVARYEDILQNELHYDLPGWMRRYVHAREIGDAIAVVPGLEWLGEWVSDQNVMYDPLNFFSFAPLYRAFKSTNPTLPGEDAGMAFIGPFVDALEDWGLGLNPFVRKPLEHAGVLSSQSWRTVFPQTALAVALSRKYINDRWADRILDLESWIFDPIFTAISSKPSDEAAQNFNEYVQMEMANQAARGEKISRARAEEKIRDFFLVQTVIGYLSGAYLRRMTPEDAYLYKLTESAYFGTLDNPTDEELQALSIWRRRKHAALDFDRYVEALPFIEAYYQHTSWRAAQDFKLQHPEIIPYVDPAWRGRPFSLNYVQTAALATETGTALELFKLADTLDLDFETVAWAEDVLVTPELEQFWRETDTPIERREKHLSGLYHQYLLDLNNRFFALPEGDHVARDAFLAEHPELERWWMLNNDPTDDLRSVINSTLADLREVYFRYADKGDWDSANAFLAKHPYLFDSARGQKYRYDRTTGRFASGGGGGDGVLSQHAQDYLAVKDYLDTYFGLPKGQRSAWLQSGTRAANLVLEYFKKYADANRLSRSFTGDRHLDELVRGYFDLPKGSAARKAYLKKHPRVLEYFQSLETPAERRLRKAIDAYFKLPKGPARADYLRNHPEVWRFFEKHGSGESFQPRDPALQAAIDGYFALPAGSARTEYLKKHPEVLAYFESRQTPEERRLNQLVDGYFALTSNQAKRDYLDAHPEVLDYFNQKRIEKGEAERTPFGPKIDVYAELSPQLAQRLTFWDLYWNLPPDKRAKFARDNAAAYGVVLQRKPGEQERFDSEQAWLIEGLSSGQTPGSKLYLHVKPLVDHFFSLSHEDRQKFVQANPELAEYLDRYGDGSISGNKSTDGQLRQFFSFPRGSVGRASMNRRSAFIRNTVGSNSGDTGFAVGSFLEHFFRVRDRGRQRELLLRNPGVRDWFQYARNKTDHAGSLIAAARLMRLELGRKRYAVDLLAVRRDRQPLV